MIEICKNCDAKVIFISLEKSAIPHYLLILSPGSKSGRGWREERYGSRVSDITSAFNTGYRMVEDGIGDVHSQQL